MKTTYIAILVLTLSAAGCSAMLDFKDYGNAECGNGVMDATEQCDNGVLNSDSEDGACRTNCLLARCGDGWTDVFELGEACDSGEHNGEPGRCNIDCTGMDTVCGDGVLTAPEQCESGAMPTTDCAEFPPYEGGELSCDPHCHFDVTGCGTSVQCNPTDKLECEQGLSAATTGMGSTDNTDDYCNGVFGPVYTGRELIYRFHSVTNEHVVIDLAGMTGDLDILVLEDNGGCDPNPCVALGGQVGNETEAVGFPAEANRDYLIVIEGFNEVESGFELQLRCDVQEDCENGVDDNADNLVDCADPMCVGHGACPDETDCADDVDNNGNGLTDCADPGCFGNGDCECELGLEIECDVLTSGTTVGEQNTISSGWCGQTEPFYTGPEQLYTWVALDPLPTSITVQVDSFMQDVDLFVLAMTSGEVCEPRHCIASSITGESPESVTFTPVAGTTYTFVVDGWDGAETPFNILASCF